MIKKFLLVAALLCPLALVAQEKFDGKPGLWETTVVMQMGGVPAIPVTIDPDALAGMPPEQRAQMEAMASGRGGGGQRTQVTKVCMTPESFKNGFPVQEQRACTQKLVSSSAGKMQIHLDCEQGRMKTSGDMTVERVDAEHSKGTMAMKASEGGERSIEMKSTFAAKWLSADCGNVKPAGDK